MREAAPLAPPRPAAAPFRRPEPRVSVPPVPAPAAAVRSAAAADPLPSRLAVEDVTAWYGPVTGVRDVTVSFQANTVTALIGPSGCGKSTFLRTLNRMHELVPGARVDGRVLLDGYDIYERGVNPIAVRRKLGMVFQKPTPFPTMSIRDNVAAGLKVGPRLARPDREAVVERALRRAALWDEVKDRLDEPATALSGGQQQRLCVARTLAPEPEVVLLDEPTASLDPTGTARIEELVHELKQDYTVIIVTHNMQQAARVSDITAFFYMGELVEVGATPQMFTTPSEARTEAYITGRFG